MQYNRPTQVTYHIVQKYIYSSLLSHNGVKGLDYVPEKNQDKLQRNQGNFRVTNTNLRGTKITSEEPIHTSEELRQTSDELRQT